MLAPPSAAWRVLVLQLAVLLLAGPATAASLVCTSQSDFDWPAVDDTSQTDWDCADADSPGPDDHFVVAHAVAVTGDLLQDGAVPGVGIRVAPGGSLQASVPVTLALGDQGLVCDPGSVCALEGRYRQFGDPTPAALADPDALASFVVGDVLPCPDASGQSDCSQPALRHRVRFSYPQAKYGPGGPEELPNICASLAAIDDGGGAGLGDVIAFWNPVPLDVHEGPDTNFWYEIEAVDGASDPCTLDFSVHQGGNDQHGYPLARREIAVYQPMVPIAAGDRVVELPGGSLPADDYHNGRMLRLEAAGAPEPAGYRIHDSVAGATDACADGVGPCDLIHIADHRGFALPKDAVSPDEDEVWVDYGWEPGDPFLVVAPVRLKADVPARASVPIELRGSVTLAGVVFDRTDTLTWDVSDQGVCEDVWLRDLFSGSGDKLHLESGIDCRRLCITGGDPVQAQDISHTVVAATSAPIAFDALGMRHGGDDFFSVQNGFTPEVTFHRYRAQFKSTNAPSDECIATGGDPVTVVASDVECLDAVNSGSVLGPSSGDFSADGVVAIASRGPLWGSSFGSADPVLTDVTVIGSELDNSNAEIVPVNADRFVARDSVNTSGRLLNGATGYIRNGIVKDNRINNALGIVVDDIEVDNVAFLRTGRVGGTAADLVSSITTPGQAVWRNVLFVQEDGAPVFQRIWRLRSGLVDLSGFTWSGIAFVDHTGAPAAQALLNQSGIALDHPTLGIDFAGPLCFWGNHSDADAASLTQLPPGSLRGVDPQFVDPSSDHYEVAPGSPWDLAGCGVRRGSEAPGIHAFRRYHAWSNLVPESMATACSDGVDNDGDGLADFLDDPGCASSADGSENDPALACDDGVDNDGDGFTDFPADVGCANPLWPVEDPACQDGVDNDGDGFTDWDGAGGGGPDPQCAAPHVRSESPGCGLGAEVAPLLLGLAFLRRRR